jgi:hypothetical protein
MNDSQLRQFLLRQLVGDQASRVEEAILLEDGFAERLREAEFDLLDDYAHSRLDPVEAAAVERYLLGSAENQGSVRIARALRQQGATLEPRALEQSAAPLPQAMRPAKRSRRGPAQVAWVASLLAACVIAIAVIPRWSLAPGSTHSLPPLGAGSPAAQAPGLTPASGLRIVSLLADVNRGAARASVTVETGTGPVRLQAEVTDATGATSESLYALYIDDPAGRRLFEASALAVHTAGPYRYVEAVVPAAALAPGDRTVVLVSPGDAAGSAGNFRWQLTGVVATAAAK